MGPCWIKGRWNLAHSRQQKCYVTVCHVILRYDILCVQQFLRLTPVRTREKPNIKGCCYKGFNNLTRIYAFHLFHEKFPVGQRLFNETEFVCAITSRCERGCNLSLNLRVVMERKPDVFIQCSSCREYNLPIGLTLASGNASVISRNRSTIFGVLTGLRAGCPRKRGSNPGRNNKFTSFPNRSHQLWAPIQ
jgi:hypothetical protein